MLAALLPVHANDDLDSEKPAGATPDPRRHTPSAATEDSVADSAASMLSYRTEAPQKWNFNAVTKDVLEALKSGTLTAIVFAKIMFALFLLVCGCISLYYIVRLTGLDNGNIPDIFVILFLFKQESNRTLLQLRRQPKVVRRSLAPPLLLTPLLLQEPAPVCIMLCWQAVLATASSTPCPASRHSLRRVPWLPTI